jgi:hypothetical protein
MNEVEAIVACFSVLFLYSAGGSEVNQDKSQSAESAFTYNKGKALLLNQLASYIASTEA